MPERRRVKVVDQGAVEQPDGSPPEPETCDCPRLDRDEWDDVESDWSDITFLRSAVSAVMGVPVNFGATRLRMEESARAHGATVPEDAMFLLGAGRVRRPVMLEVEAAADGTKDVFRPGGTAYSSLLPAPYGEIRKAEEKTRKAAEERFGRPPDEMWVWYLTCRICSSEREYETLFIAHYRDRD